MKELDLLKKDWKKNTHSFEQISESEIHVMTHKKSSSIVKWLFIISIIEFLFWSVLFLFQDDDKQQERLQKYGIEGLVFWLNVVNVIIIVGFIYLFYKNFKTISATDTTHRLMENIIKTRKTVKYYLWYNYFVLIVNGSISIVLVLLYSEVVDKSDKIITILGQFMLWSVGLWLFYRIVYGILLKKLYQNQNELEKNEG